MAFSRRDFLAACGRAAAFPFMPADALYFAAAESPLYHLHPTYRDQPPLESLLRKRVAGQDEFALEKEHDVIAQILAKWTEDLLRSQDVLDASFSGSSFAGHATRLRQTPIYEIERVQFSGQQLNSEPFIQSLREYLKGFSPILNSELQVVQIAPIPSGMSTVVRYELVGSGNGFYREQRSGKWQIDWRKNASGAYKLLRWANDVEVRSRTYTPVFEDVTRAVLGGTDSYSEQLARGVDYWRTVLDGASRIDIYGHNGVALGDFDGDGLDDLYVCQPAGLPNRLYRNRGDRTFEDVTESAGVGVLENTACALFADFRNCGRQDLLVVRANGPLLFENEGNGKFTAKADAFRFTNAPQGTFTGASIADYDRNGLLDVYFCLYVYYQGADQYKYPSPYFDANNGPPNFLMRNNGDGTFTDVTTETGLDKNNTRYSFCCGWSDFDGDGWPDLYVVNDFGRKNLYRNNGDGTFTDIADQAGVQDVGAGMSVCCFDYDNDGREDLYVANMWSAAGERITGEPEFHGTSAKPVRALYRKHAMGNTLLRNDGSGSFEDTTAKASVGTGRWAWSSDAWDFDHDGFPDLYITNGMVSGPLREDLNGFFWRQIVARSPDEPKPSLGYEQGWNAINELIRADYSWSGFERNVFYANNGDGTFSDISGAVGMDFEEDGRAFGLSDFDGDGRLEVFLKNRNAPQLRVLANVANGLPPAISFRLRGVKSNRDAIGAIVAVETSVGRQMKSVQAGSGFLSQHSKEVFFGLGAARGPIRVSIRWPSGVRQSFNDVPPNHRIFIEEGRESFRAEGFRAALALKAEAQVSELLPQTVETWLLAPVPAPDHEQDGHPALIYLHAPGQQSPSIPGVRVRAEELNTDSDTAAVYNILVRSLFDRHRDLVLPTALLVNAQGEIVKIYQGDIKAERVREDTRRIPQSRKEAIAAALPFAGNANTFDFYRNHLSLGSAFFQRGYYDEAALWFQTALRADPTSAEAAYGLGSVYLKQSNAHAAADCFTRAVKLQASYPGTKANAWNNLGLIAAQAGQMADAVGYFREALKLDAEHVIAWRNLGNAYRREKNWNDAREALQRALSISPDDSEINYSLAMVFAQTGQPDRAYSLLKHALELQPNYPEAMNNLGVLYLRTHRRDEAVAEFEACIRAAPDFDQSYLNLARVHMIEGDPEKARQTLRELLKRKPNDAAAESALEQIR